jgi:hypothetical protein
MEGLGRYVWNSPIFYADRVQTPMMIVQGGLDSVPIQQGEESSRRCIGKANGFDSFDIGVKVMCWKA